MPGHFTEQNEDAGRIVSAGTPNGYSPWVTTPFFPSYVESAENAYKSVLSDVGQTEPVLDDHDARVIRETLNGTTTYRGSVSGIAGLPDSELDVGGYEDYPATNRAASWDSDGDGLPDFWEKARGLNPQSPHNDYSDANRDGDGNGYTELDEYLAWMALPHDFLSTGAAVTVDLARAFAGFTASPRYSSPAASNGSVTLSGSTATFTPTACGFASFALAVTDSAGASMTKRYVAFADDGSGSCL